MIYLQHLVSSGCLPSCVQNLYKEHLKISNVDGVDEIIFSEEWLEFFDMLKNRPEDWPDICIKICDR